MHDTFVFGMLSCAWLLEQYRTCAAMYLNVDQYDDEEDEPGYAGDVFAIRVSIIYIYRGCVCHKGK